MKTNHLFASAAVAAVLVMTAPAQAQMLGGAVRGGAGGAFGGSFGNVSAMGNTHGAMSAGTDPSLRGTTHAQRAAAEEAREASKISARASDTTTAAVRADRDRSDAVAQGAIMSGARETHQTSALAADAPAADAPAEAASTATFAGENGDAVAGKSSNARPAGRPGKSAESSAHTPARSGSSATQSAREVRDASDSQSAEHPRKIVPEADGSASASGDASVNVSTEQ